jgi:hypothetical protein
VYLGSLVTPTNDVSLEIQRRIQTANRCLFGLRKHLLSSHLSRPTKFTIHKTLIRPALLYGNENWVLTKRGENQLLVFEKKASRFHYTLVTSSEDPKTHYKKLYSEPNPTEGEIK